MPYFINNQVKSCFKNILFYIGITIVGLGMYLSCKNFLKLHYVENESELEEMYQIDNEDIIAGRVPTSYNEKLNGIYTLLRDKGITEDDLLSIKHYIEENSLNFKEIYMYLENEKGMNSISVEIEHKFAEKKGTMDEINEFLSFNLAKNNFSQKLSNKFIDFLSLYIAFFTIIMSVFIFGNEMKKDTYELLHTKPIKASYYILSKLLGTVISIILASSVLLIVLSICAIKSSSNLNVSYEVHYLFWQFLIFCVPPIIYICSVCCLLTLLFKNPLITVPLLFLQILYSNTGEVTSNGSFTFVMRPFSLLYRFPGAFFSTEIKNEMYNNSILLLVVSLVIIFVSIQLWKRRTTI